ncbi:hypothetical protein Tco_1308870 [Tanacetum coccineum]
MSLSLAKNVIVARADNRPPMLDKTQYSSWASLTEPGTLTTPAIMRTRRYDELILKSFEKLVTLKQQTLFYKAYHKIFIIWRESQSCMMSLTCVRNFVIDSRVKVPAGRYVVPTGKDNIIVSAGRTKVIPAGSTILVLSLERASVKEILLFLLIKTSQNPSQTYPMPSPSVSTFTFPSTTEPVFSASTSEPVFESPNHSQTSQTTQSQQLQQYHTTTVSNNNAKFPYLKKEEYETWAMKMEY